MMMSRIDALAAQEQLTLKVASVLDGMCCRRTCAPCTLFNHRRRDSERNSRARTAGFLRAVEVEEDDKEEEEESGTARIRRSLGSERHKEMITAAVVKSLSTDGDGNEDIIVVVEAAFRIHHVAHQRHRPRAHTWDDRQISTSRWHGGGRYTPLEPRRAAPPALRESSSSSSAGDGRRRDCQTSHRRRRGSRRGTRHG